MNIDKLIHKVQLYIWQQGFSSLMNIDKLIRSAYKVPATASFSSLMNIDKLIRKLVNYYQLLVLAL